MGAASSIQFNVRINEITKQEGDRVFAAIGLTPTNAVRALYELAIRNKHNPEVIASSLDLDKPESVENDQRQIFRKKLCEGRLIVDNALIDMGIEDAPSLLSGDANERALQYKDIARVSVYEKYC